MNRKMTPHIVLALSVILGLALVPPSVHSQDAVVDPSLPDTTDITVSPATEARPALRYTLLPEHHEKQPGNAAAFYKRAMLMRQSGGNLESRYAENAEKWDQWPLDEATQKEIQQWLNEQEVVFAEIRKAAYCDGCDWGMDLRDLRGLETVDLRLPEVHEARNLARALRFKIRLAIVNGQLVDALEMIRHGNQLGRDVAELPTLVSSLVGIAIVNMMSHELVLLQQHADAPNMYWAIASLPQPMIDIRNSMEQERRMITQMFPVLIDVETAQYTTDQWHEKFAEAVRLLRHLSASSPNASDPWGDVVFTGWLALTYPRAKQQLIASGMPADQVNAMPVPQVLLIQTARATEYAVDEMFKWSFLPMGTADKYMRGTEQRLIQEGYLWASDVPHQSPLPIASLVLPSVNAALYAPVRLQRRLAALQTVEALRMYAAENDAQLPDSLQQITHVPVPVDPLTNEPLAYRREGDAAIIDVPHPHGRPRAGERFVVRIRQ